MIKPAGTNQGFEYTLADAWNSSLPNIEKKSLPTMGHPTECHMASLFKPKTFESRLESLSKPIISDTHLLNPSQFKRVGEDTLSILSNINIPIDDVINVLQSHQDNNAILSTYRSLLIQI
ncbi:hypothetical protein ACU6U9_07655 [Pseudomonas sp. HK3]